MTGMSDLGRRVDDLDNEIGGLARHMIRIESRQGDIIQELHAISDSGKRVESNVDTLRGEMGTLRGDVDTLRGEMGQQLDGINGRLEGIEDSLGKLGDALGHILARLPG